MRTATLAAALALCAAACGDAPAPAAPHAAPVPPPPAPRAAAPAPAEETEVDRLLAAWTAAAEDPAAFDRAEDALLAAAPDVLARLVTWLGDPDPERQRVLSELVRLLDAAAVDALLPVLRQGAGDARRHAVQLLASLLPSALDGPRGEAVCRALVTLLRSDDAETASEARERLSGLRPAARCVAAELAAMWCEDGSLAGVLESLGTDAAPAASTLARWLRTTAAPDDPESEAAQEHAGRIDEVFRVLSAVGTADPSILGDLRAALAAGPSETRRRVAVLLRSWGDDGAAAVPELLAALRDPDEDARRAAAATLGRTAAGRDAARGPLLEALTTTDEARRIGWTLDLWCFEHDAAFAAALLAAAPALSDDAYSAIRDALSRPLAADTAAAVRALAVRSEAERRVAAVELWTANASEGAAPPAEIRALLDDGDGVVRAAAMAAVAGRPGVDAARVRSVAVGALADGGYHASTALRVLGAMSDADPVARAAVVAALDDPDLCRTALEQFTQRDAPVPGRHPVLIATLLAVAFEPGREEAQRDLLQLDGGPEALVAAVHGRLEALTSAGADRERWVVAAVVHAAAALGPRAAPLRPLLERLRAELPASTGPWSDRDEVEHALAAIDGDLESTVTQGSTDRAKVDRLLAAGERGRRALVVLAGAHDVDDETWAEWFEGVGGDAAAVEAILAASSSRDPADRHAALRREGAARLAPLLPAARARDLLRKLARDDAHAVRETAVDGWRRLLVADPGAVAADDVAVLLAGDPELGHLGVLRLAGAMGPRGRDLVAPLRRLRDGGGVPVRCNAAFALWRITRDPSETLPAVRAFLVRPATSSGTWFIDWETAATVLSELPFTAEDVAGLVRAIHDVGIAREALLPALARLGPAAEPSVPVLRRILGELPPGDYHMGELLVEEGWVDTEGHAVARALAAIGPAARTAIPDLEWRIREVGDRHGVLRDTIEKLRASER